MKQGMVSIIILNWNGLSFTKQCIDSVRHETSYPNFEIIVVDNGSKKAEVSELKKMNQKKLINKLILNESNKGFSTGNNQGMAAAGGEYLLLLNNDITVSKNWLSNLVKVANQRPETGIVGPNIVLHYDRNQMFGWGYVDDSGAARHSFKNEGNAEQVGGAALFFKRKVFDRISGLDPGFNPLYFEETDFCARARKAGFKIVYTMKSTVLHFEGGVMKKQPDNSKFVLINRNRLRYMLIHFSVFRLLKAVPFELGRIAKHTVTLKLPWLLKAYAINIASLPEIVNKRMRYKKGNLKP